MGKNKLKNGNLKNNVTTAIIKSLIIFALFISTAACLCYFTDMDFDKYYIVLIISAVISAFISGFSYSRKMRKKGILCGIISSLPIALILITLSLILSKASVTVLLPITVAAIVLSGAVSGTLGVNFGR